MYTTLNFHVSFTIPYTYITPPPMIFHRRNKQLYMLYTTRCTINFLQGNNYPSIKILFQNGGILAFDNSRKANPHCTLCMYNSKEARNIERYEI